MHWVNLLVFLVTGLLLVPIAVLCAECLAALLPRRRNAAGSPRPRPPLAVLIPAHNEEVVLARALRSILPQLGAGDQVLVVADNCTDATASVARVHGAEVAERNDPHRQGKGYALSHGVRHLERAGRSSPRVLIVVDADCVVHPGAIDALAAQVAGTGRPAQAVYLLDQPARTGPRGRVSTLAFLVKNLVRPAGLTRLGLPCLLTGTGMAFPWEVIRRTELASGNLVEDMQLALDLALAGHPSLLCQDARVTSRPPDEPRDVLGQRRRWEHGHLVTLCTQAPRLLKAGLLGRRLGLLALALELSVPPLSLLVLLVVAAGSATTLAAWHGASWVAPGLLLGGGTSAVLCLLAAWAKYGRSTLPFSSLLAAPLYVTWKVPLYAAFLIRRQTEWVSTRRSTDGADGADVPEPSAAPPQISRPVTARAGDVAPTTGDRWEGPAGPRPRGRKLVPPTLKAAS